MITRVERVTFLRLYQRLADRQVSFKEATNKLLKERFRRQRLKPVITISRETGSGGRPIAKIVAAKLNFQYYDKKVIKMAAEKRQKRKAALQRLDEKIPSAIGEFLEDWLGIDGFSQSSYSDRLREVILYLARKGSSVILGRGANFVIPMEQCFRVRIIAPLKTRLYNSIKYESNTPLQARKEIRRLHFGQKDFIRKYFNKNISNANYYDLVVNTERLTLEQAAEIIVSAYKAKFPQGFIYL